MPESEVLHLSTPPCFDSSHEFRTELSAAVSKLEEHARVSWPAASSESPGFSLRSQPGAPTLENRGAA